MKDVTKVAVMKQPSAGAASSSQTRCEKENHTATWSAPSSSASAGASFHGERNPRLSAPPASVNAAIHAISAHSGHHVIGGVPASAASRSWWIIMMWLCTPRRLSSSGVGLLSFIDCMTVATTTIFPRSASGGTFPSSTSPKLKSCGVSRPYWPRVCTRKRRGAR